MDDEGTDGVVSSTMKIKVIAPTRYGLEDLPCVPASLSFCFFCLWSDTGALHDESVYWY